MCVLNFIPLFDYIEEETSAIYLFVWFGEHQIIDNDYSSLINQF